MKPTSPTNQGETVPACQIVVGEHTGALSAYVGMTRGRIGFQLVGAYDQSNSAVTWS